MNRSHPAPALIAILAFVIALEGCDGCRKPNEQTGNISQSPVLNAPPAAPKPTRLLTKVPGFAEVWNGVKDQDLLLRQYSPQYSAAFQSIAKSTNGISDPQLRAQAISDAWSQYDDKTRAAWFAEAKQGFLQHQSKFLTENADKLFEIGRVGYVERPFDNFAGTITGNGPTDNACYPDSDKGYAWVKDSAGNSLLELCRGTSPVLYSPIAIKLSPASLDGILQRFNVLTEADIQACVDALYAQNRDTVEKEIAESGMPRNQAMAQAMEEGRQSCRSQVRDNLRVFAKGDLQHQKVAKVFVMDYQTEDVLAEVPASDVVGLLDTGWRWASPSEDGICHPDTSIGLTCE
ncbi:MAG TPA: hypothetical protein VG844_10855 [Terracidiphilus sp.]|nr:hypothetical protein [Terracidiphilus sp.]